MIRTLCLYALLSPLLSAATAQEQAQAQEPAASELPRVLFLTHSAGFTHGVVNRQGGPSALAEVQLAAALQGRFEVDATQDCADINAENLANYDVVAFYTTGELPIADEDEDALFAWVRQGGGFVAIHSGSDTYYQEPRYLELVGGYFDGHPWHQRVAVTVEDVGHPATRHLGERFVITDEIYQFKNWQPEKVRVLMSLDMEATELKKPYHVPVLWVKDYGKGRVMHMSLGHREDVWTNPTYQASLIGGVRWLLGLEPGDATPNPELSAEQEKIAAAAAKP